MIKGIAPFMPPELVSALMEMGHGDELVLCDRNYPALEHGLKIVRCDALPIPVLLDEILRLIPLDYVTDYTIIAMNPPNLKDIPPVWQDYEKILKARAPQEAKIVPISKPEFYERSKKAYVLVKTGETARFANIIIKKGVFME